MRDKKIWIGIVISILCLWLAFRKVDIKGLGSALKNANYWWVAFAFILNGLSYIPRAYRWQFLLAPVKKIGFPSSFAALTVGFMANSVLPLRIGEIVRAYAIGREENISASASFATVVVERVVDGFTLLFFFFLFLALFPFPNPLREGSLWALGIMVVILLFLIFLMLKSEFTIKVMERITKFLPSKVRVKFLSLLSSFIDGLSILRDFRSLLWIFLQSLFIWSFYAGVNLMLFRAFSFALPFYAAYILMAITCLGIIIPSSPGYVGTYHYFAILGLSLFHISKDSALSFAIVCHIVSFLPCIILGIISLRKVGMSLSTRIKDKG